VACPGEAVVFSCMEDRSATLIYEIRHQGEFQQFVSTKRAPKNENDTINGMPLRVATAILMAGDSSRLVMNISMVASHELRGMEVVCIGVERLQTSLQVACEFIII